MAVDLNDYDLYIDVYHAANKRNLSDLAQVESHFKNYQHYLQSKKAKRWGEGASVFKSLRT